MERIYLTGYMGCGKSTIGRLLAKKLGWQVIDMDSYIESRYRKKVKDIFASEGEDGFRKKERVILEELSGFENVVISTGGGAPCFFDNMKVMNDSGLCVYIRMTPEALAVRLQKAKAERPLLKDKSDEEMRLFIAEQLGKRSQFYEQAEVIVENDDSSAEETAEKIMHILNTK